MTNQERKTTMPDKIGNLEIKEVVEFDEEKYKQNLKENDFSAKETYDGESEDERGEDK